MRAKSFAVSDVGRRRATNEDAFLVDDEMGLFVVADGMGGHSAGEVASAQAVEELHAMVARQRDAIDALDVNAAVEGPDGLEVPGMNAALRVMESAVQAATYMVFGLGQANPAHKGMGTTMSALLVRDGLALLAQVGDSRIYLAREGNVRQITEDHTLVAWQLKQGIITEEQARQSTQKNVITRAVGSREYVQVDTRPMRALPGDVFLLCSDGLHGYLDEGDIARLLAEDLQTAAQRAVDLANERGGRDNITAVVVQIDD